MAVRGLASSARPSPKHVVVSGIQPTGVPHVCMLAMRANTPQLGNYLGALKLWVDLQNSASKEDELVFFIASLHALTVPQNPVQLNSDRRHLMATLLAIGLDPQRCTLFYQDQVPEHTELMWILACATPFGRLERMTTWKVCCRGLLMLVQTCNAAQFGVHRQGRRVPAATWSICLPDVASSRYSPLPVRALHAMVLTLAQRRCQWAMTKRSTWS